MSSHCLPLPLSLSFFLSLSLSLYRRFSLFLQLASSSHPVPPSFAPLLARWRIFRDRRSTKVALATTERVSRRWLPWQPWLTPLLYLPSGSRLHHHHKGGFNSWERERIDCWRGGWVDVGRRGGGGWEEGGRGRREKMPHVRWLYLIAWPWTWGKRRSDLD